MPDGGARCSCEGGPWAGEGWRRARGGPSARLNQDVGKRSIMVGEVPLIDLKQRDPAVLCSLMRGLDVVLGALVVSTIGLAVAFPLVYLTTCGPNKKEFSEGSTCIDLHGGPLSLHTHTHTLSITLSITLSCSSLHTSLFLRQAPSPPGAHQPTPSRPTPNSPGGPNFEMYPTPYLAYTRHSSYFGQHARHTH